jgi:hypothetical protein
LKYGIIILIVCTGVALALTIFNRWSTLGTLEGGHRHLLVEFSTLKRSDSPNDYLMAPIDLCPSVPDEASPIFPVPLPQLKAAWFSVIREMPRTRFLSEHPLDQFQFEQRSRFFNFPDLITVRFMAQPGGHSTLAVYSKSIYGYSDMGVNRKRVQTWVKLLRERLPKPIDGSDTKLGREVEMVKVQPKDRD